VDDDVIRDFVQMRLSRLSRIAYLLTADHHAAEDLLQNTLVKLVVQWRRVSTADNPDAYLRKILYNEHVSRWRGSGYLRRERLTDELPEPGLRRDEADDTVRRLLLQRALTRLTPKQRAVIVLRYVEDLSEVDAAAALGCSVGTVKSQTHDALVRLRALAPELAALVNDPVEVLA
jgi:RNA polymerase sigma-70 factor (sigma-E family)